MLKKYIVKDGDTGEKNYQTFLWNIFHPEKAGLNYKKANNLKSLERINIDQELIIPIGE